MGNADGNKVDGDLRGLAGKLAEAITGDHLANIWEGSRLPGRDAVARAVDQILCILFPGVFGNQSVPEAELQDFLEENLISVRISLSAQLAMAFDYQDSLTDPAVPASRRESNASRARNEILGLLEVLPGIRQILGEDLQAAYEGDPAAGSVVEVLMSYPFVQAIAVHRVSHALYQAGVPLIPRMMSEIAHSRTGIDIHPGATIGPGFFIDHGTGVVIGETTRIGQGVKLYQGVTLGALSFPKDRNGNPIKGVKRHPDIEDSVTIYAGATVLGGQTTIGRGSVIGGNCWVTSSVPPETLVVSEKARRRHK